MTETLPSAMLDGRQHFRRASPWCITILSPLLSATVAAARLEIEHVVMAMCCVKIGQVLIVLAGNCKTPKTVGVLVGARKDCLLATNGQKHMHIHLDAQTHTHSLIDPSNTSL